MPQYHRSSYPATAFLCGRQPPQPVHHQDGLLQDSQANQTFFFRRLAGSLHLQTSICNHYYCKLLSLIPHPFYRISQSHSLYYLPNWIGLSLGPFLSLPHPTCNQPLKPDHPHTLQKPLPLLSDLHIPYRHMLSGQLQQLSVRRTLLQPPFRPILLAKGQVMHFLRRQTGELLLQILSILRQSFKRRLIGRLFEDRTLTQRFVLQNLGFPHDSLLGECHLLPLLIGESSLHFVVHLVLLLEELVDSRARSIHEYVI